MFLLYRHADNNVLGDFPNMSDHLPKISEDSPKLVTKSHRKYIENVQTENFIFVYFSLKVYYR